MTFILAGFLGGIIRGVVGLVKYTMSYKDVPFRPVYFGSMALISGLIGATAAWVTQDLGISFLGLETLTPALAVIIGYAGGDFFENIIKILTKDPILFD
ncbi:MAG: hypothetical protein WD883_01540 [Candidatus Colwellbacteria bacterium]